MTRKQLRLGERLTERLYDKLEKILQIVLLTLVVTLLFCLMSPLVVFNSPYSVTRRPLGRRDRLQEMRRMAQEQQTEGDGPAGRVPAMLWGIPDDENVRRLLAMIDAERQARAEVTRRAMFDRLRAGGYDPQAERGARAADTR